MVERLAGKSVLITGGGDGLGLAISRRVRAEGGSVASLDWAESHEPDAENLLTLHGDVGNEEDLARAVERTHARFGRLDSVVSNAGTTDGPRTIEDFSTDGFDLMLHQHTLAGVLLVKYALPALCESRGSVLLTGSTAGMAGGYGPPMYSIAKAASIHLVKVLTEDLGAQGIRINSISPGLVVSAIHARAAGVGSDDFAARLANMREVVRDFQPLHEPGLPEHIAAGACFLISDDAAWVTGVNLPVDGGIGIGAYGRGRTATYAPLWEAMGRTPAGYNK